MAHPLPTIPLPADLTSPVMCAFGIVIVTPCWHHKLLIPVTSNTKHRLLDFTSTFAAFLCNPLTGVATNDIRTATSSSRDGNQVPHRSRSERNAESETTSRLEGRRYSSVY